MRRRQGWRRAEDAAGPMSDESAVARRLYAARAARDWCTVGALYADDAQFSDSAFATLDAGEVRAMWRMLLSTVSDLAVEYEVLDETAIAARMRWRATYAFTQTGRHVVNVITAALQLRDGCVVRHVDSFDFHAWARQALGVPGLPLGWVPSFQRKVQARARGGLRRFMQHFDEGRPA